MNGVLVVDKPSGPTSHDVVARARRALGTPRVGHTGTLDPLATGVLPLVVGKATRLARYLAADEKEYLAEVRFGAATDTYDAQGRPEVVAVPHLTAAAIERLLPEFRGRYLQTPPPFSAKKIAGTPAYRLARSRQAVQIQPVEVTVSVLELLTFEHGLARLRVVASSGFYVRVLAHDLGQRAGCGAHLEALRRIRAGEFRLDAAVSLDSVERAGRDAAKWLIPMEQLLAPWPRAVLNERGIQRVVHGQALAPADFAEPPPAAGRQSVRLLDGSGRLVGVGAARPDGLLHPAIVLV